jgi:Trk K+ transport system NAD-binding subunit
MAETERRRILIVGCGQSGRTLARSLSESWDIAILDTDAQKLERLKQEAPDRGFRLFAKDGTSLLNLREAGLERAEWLVAISDDDEVNFESCRLARSAESAPTVIGVARRPDRRAAFEEIGAEAVVRPEAVAALIRNRIEWARKVASGVGLGLGEILEIPILRSSPAVDVRVRDLKARRWVVAAIYRKDRYVVPHGYVEIRQGDRLLLTGEPEILPAIADYLRAGVARFPLQYGSRIVVVPGGERPASFWNEVKHLMEKTRGRALRVLAPREVATPRMDLGRSGIESQELNPTDSLLTVVKRDVPPLDCGCLVLPRESASLPHRLGLTRPRFAAALDLLSSPVLLAQGVHPYRRILLPILDRKSTTLSAELAIDLGRQLDIPVVLVNVVAPAFIAGTQILENQQQTLETVLEVASMYHLKTETLVREGNPPREMARITREGDLLVLGLQAGRRASVFRPDAAIQIALRCPSSVLLLAHP